MHGHCDSAPGVPHWGGGFPLREERLEAVLQLHGRHTPQPPWKGEKCLLVKPEIQEEQCVFCPGGGKLDQLYSLARALKWV